MTPTIDVEQALDMSLPIDFIQTDLVAALADLIHVAPKKLIIKNDRLTEEGAQIILSALSDEALKALAIEIVLPNHLINTPVQMSIDHIMSNHQRSANIASLSRATTDALPKEIQAKAPVGRSVPNKIKPKIDITLFEPIVDEPRTLISEPNEPVSARDTSVSQQIIRSPLPEKVIQELLALYPEQNEAWMRCFTRDASRQFRAHAFFLPPKSALSNHPLSRLLDTQTLLKERLNHWTKVLKLEATQYNALLDVYGQYGLEGLNKLLSIWDNYDPHQRNAFIKTHEYLLHHMDSYIPFIKSDAYNELIRGIATLGDAKLSWWLALLKNHELSQVDPKDLLTLYAFFIEHVKAIEALGLQFKTIETITEVSSLTNTLSNMLALLNKSDKKDLGIQWDCIHQVPVSQHQQYYFIIPEMQLESAKETPNDIEAIKRLLKQESPCSLQNIEPAFYRYLATQKQRLSLEQYKSLFQALSSATDSWHSGAALSDKVKIGMAYILAKTTSTDLEIALDMDSILNEWESFKSRLITLEYIERINANRGYLGSTAFMASIRGLGGVNQLRIDVLSPLLDMHLSPLLSYLNKLLKLSEYRFLDPQLSIVSMKGIQKTMMVQMAIAADIYQKHPEAALEAIRLIKTATVEKNASGHYFPKAEDIDLLEKFITTAQILTLPEHNKIIPTALNPELTLFPLLTVFNLEYEHPDAIKAFIRRYINTVVTVKENEDEWKLFAYGLSLLKSIQKRETSQGKLSLRILEKIQAALLTEIKKPNTSRKCIRELINKQYAPYFEGSEVLSTNEPVEISAYLAGVPGIQEDIRASIGEVLSHFIEDGEPIHHAELAVSLAGLAKNRSKEQQLAFLNYCNNELKENGFFSRAKHDTPPSYLSQFKSLISSLNAYPSFEEFERIVSLIKESALKNKEDRNSLGKCAYFLKTLYPALLDKGYLKKEAFNFAAELVCYSPVASLSEDHAISNPGFIKEVDKRTKILNRELIQFSSKNPVLEADLNQLKSAIKSIVDLGSNPEAFSQLKNMIALIEQTIADINRRKQEYDSKNLIGRGLYLATHYFINDTACATSKELESIRDDFFDLKYNIDTQAATYPFPFHEVGVHLYTQKARLLKRYSNISKRIHDFMSMALRLSCDNIVKKHNDTCQLIDHLIELDDQNLVLSLMYHYCGGQYGGVHDLLNLLINAEYKALDSSIKKDFIKAIISQMNNGAECTQQEISQFLSFISGHRNNKQVMDHLKQYYMQPPFPPLTQFIRWHNEQQVEDAHAIFDKNPCARNGKNGREEGNGFKKSKAIEVAKILGLDEPIFTQAYLNHVEACSNQAKQQSTEKIISILKSIKEHPPIDNVLLVMYCAELLHRCKGRPPIDNGFGQAISGRSFELNTTQIIAILSLLETGKRVTAEIATGEGKSRIMMILGACQFLKGNTVDFLTSNLALAERDYLEALPFFHSLGATVNFITGSSNLDEYQKGGINVSDPEHLCLFRNKAMSRTHTLGKESQLPLDPVPTQRALLLDEADVAYFDLWNMKYNYSSETSQRNIDLLPLYPLLMEFFAQDGSEAEYLRDKVRCNELLLAFIMNKNKALYDYTKALPLSQLEGLQTAAYTARTLEYNVDYAIVTDAVIATPLGDKKVAAARCRVGSRINDNAQFSEGVHQCLHAELNRLLNSASLLHINEDLKAALDKCKSKHRLFHITPERDLSCSSSANSMLCDYKEGSIHAVTGTIGSKNEQEEAGHALGTEFIQVPRHEKIQRKDRPIRVTENEQSHLEVLIAHIKESRKKKQPILIICKDDRESQALYKKLETHLGNTQLQRIHAATNSEDEVSELSYIKEQSGLPGQVTISTEMISRGTDIELQKEAHQAGLKVLLTYLPNGSRDYGQIIGRSGRYGAIGETQMLLNLEGLKNDYGINMVNSDFYRCPETYIHRLQHFSAYTKQLHRLFNVALDNHLIQFKTHYDELKRNQPDIKAFWPQFLKDYHRIQEASDLAIKIQLESEHPKEADLQAILSQHATDALLCWRKYTSESQGASESRDRAEQLSDLNQAITIPVLLNQWLQALKDLPHSTGHALVSEKITVKVYDEYDPALAGHRHILKNAGSGREWFANFRAWRRNEGMLFPNLRSWWAGELSFWNLISQLPLVNWFIKPHDEELEVTKEVPSTYALLFKSRDFQRAAVQEEACSKPVFIEPFIVGPMTQATSAHFEPAHPGCG